MPILGNDPGAWNDYNFYGTGAYPNQVCTDLYTMPVPGWVTLADFYASASSGSCNFTWVVWDQNSNVITNGSAFSVGSGSQTPGGQAWQSQSCGFYLAQNQQVRIGWWRDPSGTMLFSTTSQASDGWLGSSCPSSPGALGTLSAPTYGHGIGAYLTYTQIAAPTATTGNASSITATSATLNGSVADGGQAGAGGGTSSWALYISPTPSGGTLVASGNYSTSTNPTGNATGLSPSTQYYLLVQSTNLVGTTQGSWVPFMTLAGTSTFSIAPPGGMTTALTVGGYLNNANTPPIRPARAMAHLLLATGGGTATYTAVPTFSSGSASANAAASLILYGPSSSLPYVVTAEIDGVLGVVQSVTENFYTPGQIVLPVPGNVTGMDLLNVLVTAQAPPQSNIEVAAVAALLGTGVQYVFAPPNQPLPVQPPVANGYAFTGYTPAAVATWYQVLAANPLRRGLMLYAGWTNLSHCSIGIGGSTGVNVVLLPGAEFECPGPIPTTAIWAYWDVAPSGGFAGFAAGLYITEIT
jgi:hypothetical protein